MNKKEMRNVEVNASDDMIKVKVAKELFGKFTL